MKNYTKPIVVDDYEMSEGIYADSGTLAGNDCYTVHAVIMQSPETGRGDYRIQVTADHNATDHHSTGQVLTISFNQPVTYNGTTGSSISASFSYHNNNSDSIGLGDYIVTSDAGLAITGASMSCNRTCSQHDGLGNY